MSNEAITWAFKQELPSTQKFVLVALADYADDDHSCYPSHAKTAKRVGASRPTVKRALVELEKKGYITHSNRHREDGTWTSNRYVLRVGWSPEGWGHDEPTPVHQRPGMGSPVSQGGVTEIPGVGIQVSQGGVTEIPGVGIQVSHHEPSLNPHLPSPASPESASRRKPRRPLPDQWTPTEAHEERAREKNLDIQREAEAFRSHAESVDRRAANWNAAFTTWLLNARPQPRQEFSGWDQPL